jgi:hypothetical protein
MPVAIADSLRPSVDPHGASVSSAHILRLLYRRLRELERSIEDFGYRTRLGFENEFYVSGPRASSLLASSESLTRRLTQEFPEILRVYPEADVVTLRGMSARLGIPRLRKWEVVTRHEYADGTAIPVERQARIQTEIRAFIVEEAARHDHVAHFGAKPFRDLRDVCVAGTTFHVAEAELLDSLREQVHGPEFRQRCHEDYLDQASVHCVGRLRQLRPEAPAGDIVALVRAILRCRAAGDRLPLPNDLAAALADELEAIRIRASATAFASVTSILNAPSLAALCAGPDSVILAEAVPGCGVDANISLADVGGSAFYDSSGRAGCSVLCRAVAVELIRTIGNITGSLLPAIQSYSAESFWRLGRVAVGAPSRASLGPKAAGASCKVSPDSAYANPARAIAHDHDVFGPGSIRLEVRIADPGGGTGWQNALASPHYAIMILTAVVNGIAAFRNEPYAVPDWDDVLGAEQPLDLDLSAAIDSFERSRILRDGYGPTLHDIVASHARSVTGLRRA